MGQALTGIGDGGGPAFGSLTAGFPRLQDGGTATAAAPARTGATRTGAGAGDSLRYSVERGADRLVLVFKVVDATTNQVVSQTPWSSPQSVPQDPNYRSGALLDQFL